MIGSPRRAHATPLSGLGIVLMLGMGCATTHASGPEPVLPVEVVEVDGPVCAAGPGHPHHHPHRDWIGARIVRAIFADQFDHHDWEHAHREVDVGEGGWCEEHDRYEATEVEEPEEETGHAAALPGPQSIEPVDLLFDPGSARLSMGARSRLGRLADAIRERDDVELVVRGHTDVSYEEQAAIALSEQRADEVREFLVAQGLRRDRIGIVGLGATRPVASNDTLLGRQQNRRVEIVFLLAEAG